MLFNYFKITIRSLVKDKLHSIINIFGLSIGLAVSILMFLYISNEFSFDDFHENGERIFQVSHTRFDDSGASTGYFPHAPIPLGPALEQDIAEVQYAIRFTEDVSFVRTDLLTAEESILMADRTFFKSFTFPFQNGNPEEALNNRYSCVITSAFAEKYFGEANPTGKTLDVLLGEEYVPITVDGILSDIPSNSSFQFSIVLPYDLLNRYEWFRSRQDSWNSWNSPTFILLKKNTRIEDVQSKMVAFWEKYKGEEFAESKSSGKWKFDFQPVRTKFIALKNVRHTQLKYNSIAHTQNPEILYILGSIGLGILLLACINFMNLSISRASNRYKEVAVRKVIGARRNNLIFQFWGEAILVSIISTIFALGIVALVLPVFNSLLQSNISLNLIKNGFIPVGILLISIITGMIAGLYPGLFMSSLKPVQIFSRKLTFGGSNLFTKALIVVQFSLAIFFILGTLIIAEQLSYISDKDLGFDKEQTVVIRGNFQKVNSERILRIYKNTFAGDPDIAGFAGLRFSFARGYDNIGYSDSRGRERRLCAYRVDENFIKLLNIDVVQGRDFNNAIASDSTDAVIVNETLVKEFELTNAIGQKLDGFKNRGLENPVIIGVVKDFHFKSLYTKIEPAILYTSRADKIMYIYAKLNPNRISSGLEKLKSEWAKIEPAVLFQYSFLDNDLEKQYKDAQHRQKIINYSAGFAIFIAAIGLFGLASYSSVRRKKEIGIRKILGASVLSIVKRMNMEFLVLATAANIIAWPAAWFVMDLWLKDFAYRINMSLLIFLSAGIIAVLIALFTVSFHAVRTAFANPVESLRYE